MSDYAFWEAQLAGENPDCGELPGCGFYKRDRRVTYYDPVIGIRRKRVEKVPEVIAIWMESDGILTMRTDNAKRETRITTELLVIEPTFARACRNAISYEDYHELLREYSY